MKAQILPPARVKIGGSYLFYGEDDGYLTAWSVVSEVAPEYRYRRAIASETQRDLLRFAALNVFRVSVGVSEGRTPYFYFDRELVNAWLDQGGRTWIIAELEARSTRRVVAFPRRRSLAP